MLVEPTHSERATAATMHVSSLFLPFVAPALFLALHHRRSEFVRSHSLTALKEAVVTKLLLVVAFVVSASYTIYRLLSMYQADWKGFSLSEFLLRFAIGYIALAVFGLLTA